MWSTLATAAQVVSVLVAVVIGILSFNQTRQKEAEARKPKPLSHFWNYGSACMRKR
jgi:hypothetical protein